MRAFVFFSAGPLFLLHLKLEFPAQWQHLALTVAWNEHHHWTRHYSRCRSPE
jgi:hypothetical protein